MICISDNHHAETKSKRTSEPWQLRMFRRTLKKRERFNKLRSLLGPIERSTECLLITCGDNNGAMNYHLRELGGTWSWCDLEQRSLNEMAELLGEDVIHANEQRLPFQNDSFDVVIAIDVHEHVNSPLSVTREMCRIARDGARLFITVPEGDERRIANRLKLALGMSRETYGHVRDGFTTNEVREIMVNSAIEPRQEVTFSRFFTELIELCINVAYVKALPRTGDQAATGIIAPATRRQLESVGLAYRAYTFVYPVMWIVSRMDYLLPFTQGHVVLVEGRKVRGGARCTKSS